jgi:hypothetical protein
MFPSLGYKGVETFSMPFPMLPVLEDATSPARRNGLGELLLYLFGSNVATQYGATAAWKKVYTWETLIKTFTTWLHYSTNVNEKIRMCAVDNLALKIKADGELSLDFSVMGADLWDVLDTDYGTEAQCAMATAKQLTGLGARLEFGQPGASVRDAWEECSIDFKRNLSYGAPGKDGQHPAGSGSPRIVTSTKSNIELGINLRDLDREEIMRGRVGGNTDPSAERQSDLYSLVKARLSIFGPNICAGLNIEADYLNAGTMTIPVIAGTYTGDADGTFGVIQMSNSDMYETALGDNKDLAFKLLDPAATYTVSTGAGALSVAVVSKEITVTLAAAGSTAAAVLAAILATPAAVAVMTPTLAYGSTGAGTITEAQAKIDSTDFVDGFRVRYTEGSGYNAWGVWRMVTKTAQEIGVLAGSITVDFVEDNTAAAGDLFYYGSHYRYMLRVNLPDMNYADAVNAKFSGGIRKADIQLYKPQTSNGVTVQLDDTRATSYV